MPLEYQSLFTDTTNSVYRGQAVARGRCLGAKGRFFHGFEQKCSDCVFIEVHNQPQFTCQADTVADCSLTSNVALLVHPIGTIHSIVDCYEFTVSQK